MRDLQYEDQQVDAVLLFGPLYHLTRRADRLKCLREAYRVLRTGGILMAVGISRFISMVNCLADGLIEDPNFVSIVERDLQDGQHRNPTDNPEFFTTAFFHHPDELQNEVETAGFRLKDLLAVEGPARLLRDFAVHWQHPQKREWLLELVRNVERERHLFGMSTHLMVIADKQAA